MEKKEYTTPELSLLGDVEELTKGEGLRGSYDQVWLFSWGRPPSQDVTSG
jgi:hypothetical protein